MDLLHLIEESELLKHSEIFGFPLRAGTEEWKKELQGPWNYSKEILTKRAADVLLLRNHPEICETILEDLKSLSESESCILEHVQSETSDSAEGQIYFQGQDTKYLNHIPYCILFFVFLKIWIAPCLALLTPLLLCVMPYVIMTTIMNMNISWDIYVNLMKHMMFGIQNGEPWSMKHYMQAMWTAASIIQGMVTPFVTAYHTHKLDTTILKRAEALRTLHKKGQTMLTTLKSIGIFDTVDYDFPTIPSESHEIVAWMQDEPIGMRLFWKLLGRISIITTIASDSSWNPVTWSALPNTPFVLTDFSDLAIDSKKAVQSTLDLKGHSLLTGPNRGGKSSCLRAILQQILLGQTFGFTKGCKGSWKPFAFVFTRLKSRDNAGKESLFEMEVRMASRMMHITRAQKKHTLLLIDELFHSTNPPDAETSAKLFLKNIWNFPYCKSIISTHIFSLCEKIQEQANSGNSASSIQAFCCPANLLSNGKLQYSYKLQTGISRISSVREVLEEAGFDMKAIKSIEANTV
jgi:hypothetical protein